MVDDRGVLMTSPLPAGELLVAEPAVLTGTLIGYARVSTAGQLLDRQLRALTEAGCSRVFADQMSGRTADRPELTRCLDYLRPGDTLVVPSLDRLSRSLQDLINLVADLRRAGVGFRSLHEALDTTTPGGRLVFHVFAALAEFIRELIVEGTREGLDAARARGARLGRPPALTAEQVTHARESLTNPKTSVASIARLLGVSRSTIYAALPELAGGRGALRTQPRPAALPAAQDVDQAVAATQAPSSAPATTPDPGHDVDQDVTAAAGEAGADPVRVVDLTAAVGAGWRLVRHRGDEDAGTWRLQRDGTLVGTIRRDVTTRGRPGWTARLADGVQLPAHGKLAAAAGSGLWRTRDLAAAAIAAHVHADDVRR